MFGIGKRRSKLGKWLDKEGYLQGDFVNASEVSWNAISKACSDPGYEPSIKVMKKVLKSVRKINPDINMDVLWGL